MKAALRAVGLGLGLVLASAPRAPADERPDPEAAGEPTWYAMTLARGDRRLSVGYFWSKGPKLRAETVVAGRKVVSIVNGGTYFAYDAVSMRGIAIGRSPDAIAEDRERQRPFGNEFALVLRQGAELVGEEELGGRTCERYRVTDDAGRREVWVTKDEARLPLRIEVYTRRIGQTIQTDYVDWLAGFEVADSFFEPPPAVALERLSFDDYVERQGAPVGPVPILYRDLLLGP